MSPNGMKMYTWLVLTAAVLLFAGGCGKAGKPELEIEEVTEQLFKEIEMEKAQPEDTQEESQIVDDPAEIDLKYIPEMGYNDNIQLGGPYKKKGNLYNADAMVKKNYACWKEWLIIGAEVYKKQEDGRYKRFGEHHLQEMFKPPVSYLDDGSEIRQYENYLIFRSQMTLEEVEPKDKFCFCIYDLDTGKMVERKDFLEEGGIGGLYKLYGAPGFYVFGGKIYYRTKDWKSIRTIDLSNGKNEQFYSLAGTAYQGIENFAIREDGAVIAVFLGEQANPDDIPADRRDALEDNLPRHIEYWCIEMGGMEGKKQKK